MRNLIQMAMELSRELHTLIALVKLRQEMAVNPIPSPWLDGNQVMTALCITRKTLQKYRRTSIIPFTNVGGKIYYHAEDLMKILEQNRIKKHRKDRKLRR